MIAVPLALEFTPTRLRTRVVGFVRRRWSRSGIMVAAVVAALLPWRVAFAIGVLPVALVALHRRLRPRITALARQQGPPERGATSRGVADRAPGGRAGARDPARRPTPASSLLATCGATAAASRSRSWPGSGPRSRCRASCCGARPSSSGILDVSADEAALLFLLVALGSFAGRLFFSFVPQRLGRRTCGLPDGLRRGSAARAGRVQRRYRGRRCPVVPACPDSGGLLRGRRLCQPRAVYARDLPHQPPHPRHGTCMGRQRRSGGSSGRS